MTHLGNLQDWPDNSTLSVDSECGPLLLVKRAGRVYLYANRCPHTGKTLDPMGGSVAAGGGLILTCQRHGAQFVSDSGACVGGPCQGEQLTPLRFTLAAGDIYLDH